MIVYGELFRLIDAYRIYVCVPLSIDSSVTITFANDEQMACNKPLTEFASVTKLLAPLLHSRLITFPGSVSSVGLFRILMI